MKKQTWTNEYHNQLVTAFNERMRYNGIKKMSGEWLAAQQEFFIGAAKAISLITGDETISDTDYPLLVTFPNIIMKKHRVEKAGKL